jgi:hypothetical protein
MTSSPSPEADSPRKNAPWKRLVIISASAAAGFALVLAIIVGGLIWYGSRPKPLTAWKTGAIKATFDYVDAEGEKNTIVFYYTLENTTDFDYQLPAKPSTVVMARLEKQKSLSFDDEYTSFDHLPFLPPKQRIRFGIHVAYPYPERLSPGASHEEGHRFREKLAAYVKTELANLNGFVLFDKENRYQIELPKGW